MVNNSGQGVQISVIIPAYNCERYIERSLESALAQQVPLEILVINDCSPDNLNDVLKKYLGDSRIHYLRNDRNLGVAATRNRGVQLARGRYVAFLDSDDWWEEGKLKKQLELIEKQEAVLCCTARELMDEAGNSLGKVIPVGERITYRALLRHNSINCSSVLIRRDVALEFPMEHEDSHEDYITWLKVLNKYGFACGINEPLLKYRLSQKGKSGSKLKSAGMTFKVYRYMGFGLLHSILYFCSYAVHGIWKYR